MLLPTSHEQQRAVGYYRHSAEDKQENSVPLQRQQAHEFAKANNIKIIHEEADEGISGLQANRPGFQNLFQHWILNPYAPHFEYVLVLDVSRWGRFQDQDEAGHYEYICRQAGKKVIYVSQGLPSKDNLLIGSLRTSLERYMAAEYSRQLSDKVFRGAVAVTRQGYSAGGHPPYGMARLLLDSNKKTVRILKSGEHKQIANERVTFVPAEDRKSETVKKIFLWFVKEKRSLDEITRILNRNNVTTARNKTWDRGKVSRILENHKYCGTLVYNRTSNRLKQGRRNNPQSEWVVVKNAFPAIVDKETFDEAQIMLKRITAQQSQPIDVIAKAKQIVKDHINKLVRNESQTEPPPHATLPILFSVTRIVGKREWCFILPSQLKQYEGILAVGVRNPKLVGNQKTVGTWIEELFLLPQHQFKPMMFLLLSEQERDFQRYRIGEDAFNEIAVKMTAQKTPYVPLQAHSTV